ncbi:hypothetical protein MNBD_NITROSPIRAE01-544 [hydrothermal vent metagenome]|uniref:DUF4202 domain-containing protein n=1 Tax=hydrothermal vent metagenome TaxID=652676 RepID=A0A3B1D5C6_9ZZZZ
MIESAQFKAAIKCFDNLNRQDPNHELFEAEQIPKELLYAKRMSACLLRIAPDASEALQLAARSQHIARWKIPRSEYPMDRKGYLKWRTTLNRFHAETATEILREVGYDNEILKRVEGLLLKKHLKDNPEMQTMEDVICVVFLESYFSDFSSTLDEKKMIPIIQKTWLKMTTKGHEAALGLALPPKASALIQKALSK